MRHNKENLATFAAFCILCKEPIPLERLVRRAVTCTKEHARLLKQNRDKLKHSQGCTHCRRPCTPEDKRLWAEFRKSLPGYSPGKKGRPKDEPHGVRN